MARERKYSSGVTVGDLNAWMHQVAAEHDLQVEITLRPSYSTPSLVVAVVSVYEIRTLSERIALKTRQATIKAAGEGQWSELLRLCWSVLGEYQGDPWNWTLRDRRKASRAAQEGPGAR